MRTHRIWTALLFALATLTATPAQAQQALGFQLGFFTPTGEGGRADGDVLVANRDLFAFEVDDFNSFSFGGEWTVGLGEYLEAGFGVGFTSRSVPSVYKDYVRPDGREIEQELQLRIVPISATARVLPFGRNTTAQPYLGGGVGFFNYEYSEVGDFVDFSQGGAIDFDRYVAEGTELGLVLVAGVRVPAGDRFSIGGEVRWQRAKADLSDEFLGSTLDLGGVHYLAVFQVRF